MADKRIKEAVELRLWEEFHGIKEVIELPSLTKEVVREMLQANPCPLCGSAELNPECKECRRIELSNLHDELREEEEEKTLSGLAEEVIRLQPETYGVRVN